MYRYYRLYPPAPMNHAKIFKGRPRRYVPLGKWYKADTKHFRLTILVKKKMNDATIVYNKSSTA